MTLVADFRVHFGAVSPTSALLVAILTEEGIPVVLDWK